MRRRRVVVIALALLAARCQSGSRWISTSGAQSEILISVFPDGHLVADAEAVGDPPVVQSFKVGEHRVLYLLQYTKTLEELGLSAGPLTFAAPGAPSVPLPVPDHRYRLDVDARTDWTALAELPPPLNALATPRDPCLDLKATVVGIRDPNGDAIASMARFVVPVDTNRIMVGLADGRALVTNAQGVSIWLNDLPTGTVSQFRAGARDGSGQLWLIDRFGSSVHGTVDGGFQRGPRLIAPGEPVGLTASRGSSPFELYALTSSFAVARSSSTGAAWTRLPGPLGPVAERTVMQIEWFAPGQIAASGFASGSVYEIVNGQLAEVPIALPEQATLDSISAMKWVDGFGVLIGSRYSRIFARKSFGWEQLPPAATSARITVMAPLPGGALLFGGETQLVSQYFPGFGYCPEKRYSNFDPKLVAPLAGKLALVGLDANLELVLLGP